MKPLIRRYGAADGLNSVTWTPIVVPHNCNHFSLSNREGSDGVWFCTDPTDPLTQAFLPEGAEQSWAVPIGHDYEFPRFLRSDVAVYVKTVTGAGPVIAFWM